MQEEHLAIASMPIQTWGAIYDEREALKIGTIFKDLDKPFFAAATIDERNMAEAATMSLEQREREKLLTRIMEVSFALDDLTLYLDMHEKDQDAIALFLEKSRQRDELKKQFAEQFYPLTRDCAIYCREGGSFSHLKGPCPWEGACV